MTMNDIESGSGSRLPKVVDTLTRHRDELSRKHVNHLWVFGSVARGDENDGSDVDLLVEIDPKSHMSLTGFSSLRLDLIELLGQDVDLGEWSTLKEDMVEDVRNDAVMVF